MRQPRSGRTAQRQSCPAAHVRRNWGASWSGFTQKEGDRLCSLPKRLPSVSASQLLRPAQQIVAEQPVLEEGGGGKTQQVAHACHGAMARDTRIVLERRSCLAATGDESSWCAFHDVPWAGLQHSTRWAIPPHGNASSSSGLRDAPHCLSLSTRGSFSGRQG